MNGNEGFFGFFEGKEGGGVVGQEDVVTGDGRVGLYHYGKGMDD